MILKSDIPRPKNDEPPGEPFHSDLPDSGLARTARLILEIVPGERRLLKDFGCRVHELTLTDARSFELAGALIEEALDRWAPQLGVDRAEVSPLERGKLDVRLRSGSAWHRLAITHRHPSSACLREAEEP